MRTIAIIPARMASTRFPGKPLALISGRPMLQRVWEAACCAKGIEAVYVATDSPAIIKACGEWGALVVWTSPLCKNGTERVNEAAMLLKLHADDLVINIQGDEPLTDPADIDMLARFMVGPGAAGFDVASLFYRGTEAQAHEPSAVKVEIDPDDLRDRLGLRHEAIYFTRQPVLPTKKTLIHVGVYAFRVEFLARAAAMPPTEREKRESLEQLRWLDNGARVMMLMASRPTRAVDSPEDIFKVEKLLSAVS